MFALVGLLVFGLGLAGCGLADASAPPVATAEPSATPQASPTAQVVVEFVEATPTIGPTPAPFAFPMEIGVGQHLSASGSYTQTETEAAGPMACRIERDSCAFRQLVSNHDPRLLFSGSEPAPFGAEDRMMHPAMVLPLSTLADLVEAEWDGATQIMVTEAYDSLLDHNRTQPNRSLRYSLHFEGRSIDLIPWPPDPAQVGRLCALALDAGFSWAHNEGTHCHASVLAESLCWVCGWRKE